MLKTLAIVSLVVLVIAAIVAINAYMTDIRSGRYYGVKDNFWLQNEIKSVRMEEVVTECGYDKYEVNIDLSTTALIHDCRASMDKVNKYSGTCSLESFKKLTGLIEDTRIPRKGYEYVDKSISDGHRVVLWIEGEQAAERYYYSNTAPDEVMTILGYMKDMSKQGQFITE